jgi:hypothetical protein
MLTANIEATLAALQPGADVLDRRRQLLLRGKE